MNKYQEALERARICGDRDCSECKFNEICINDKKGWYGTLKELVDKATPKKRVFVKATSSISAHDECPVCKAKVSPIRLYCDNCGQRLE